MKHFSLLLGLALAVGAGACAGPDRPPCSRGEELETVCGFRNPEDIEFVETADIIIVSNMRHDGGQKSDGPLESGGFLSALLPQSRETHLLWPDGASAPDPSLGDPRCTEAPTAASFSPHGLTSIADANGATVYVAAHAGDGGGREAIEIFKLTGTASTTELTWKACIPSPDSVMINDVAVSADGLILASNYLPDSSHRHSVKASLFRQPTGDVMTWTRETGWSHLPETQSLMANGVALSRDGATALYTETIAQRLHRRAISTADGAIHIDLDGAPDNLTWTSRDTLLVATHTRAYELFGCFFRRGACRSAWAVYEITPETLKVTKRFAHSGDTIGAVATALEVNGEVFLSSVFDDRVGIIRLQDPIRDNATARGLNRPKLPRSSTGQLTCVAPCVRR